MLTARTVDEADEARARILGEVPGAVIETAALDLASLASVRRFATSELARGTPIDVLINNAGIMALRKRMLSEDGFELQSATNVLEPFALTGLLLPLILASPTRRIVTVSSSIQGSSGALQRHNLNSEEWYDPFRIYAQTKLMNAMLGRELQRRGKEKRLSVVVHPGYSKTNLLFRESTIFMRNPDRDFLASRNPLHRDPGRPLCGNRASPTPGTYYGPDKLGGIRGNVKQAAMSRPAYDDVAAARLFDRLEQMSRVSFNF